MVRSTEQGKVGLCLDNELALVTDRTQTDIDRWEYLNNLDWRDMTASERTEFLNGVKGAYTSNDMNRVGEATNIVAKLLNEQGYSNNVHSVTDWDENKIPIDEDFYLYLSNIRTFIKIFYILPTTPPLPSDLDYFTYEEANAIEQILLDIHKLIQGVVSEFIHSGEAYAGEDDFI